LGLADVKTRGIELRAQRRGKRERQMKGCVAEQKVGLSDWQMNERTLRTCDIVRATYCGFGLPSNEQDSTH